ARAERDLPARARAARLLRGGGVARPPPRRRHPALTLALLRRLAGSFWVRLLVSAGLLAIVAAQIDFPTLAHRITGGSWGWFAAAVAVLFASFVVAALRWQLFLDAAGVPSTRGQTVGAYLIGMFANNFLPSQMGGDVARVFLVGGAGTRMRAA